MVIIISKMHFFIGGNLMSKLKNKLLVLLAVLGAAKLAYAAVVPISQTPFSSSYGLRSAASGSDTQHTSTYSGVDRKSTRLNSSH